MMYQQLGKRLFDIAAALFGLAVSWPILVILIVLLTVINRGSPFFSQVRLGRFGHVFQLVKFRTMTDRRDADGELLSDADRLTPIGNWLRRTSLDELPQLLNILLGDMSLVGPRPLLVAYWPLYSPEQLQRHNVRPGLTGWAQINGRNALSWDEKFTLDNWYVKQYSLALDLKIMWLTILYLLMGREERTRAETALPTRFKGPSTS